MELSQSITLPWEKNTAGTAGFPWEHRYMEERSHRHKISVPPAFFRHWELSSYLDYRELKTVNTTLHGFLAQPPHSPVPALFPPLLSGILRDFLCGFAAFSFSLHITEIP